MVFFQQHQAPSNNMIVSNHFVSYLLGKNHPKNHASTLRVHFHEEPFVKAQEAFGVPFWRFFFVFKTNMKLYIQIISDTYHLDYFNIMSSKKPPKLHPFSLGINLIHDAFCQSIQDAFCQSIQWHEILLSKISSRA